MPTLLLRFPARRYHATPWGHHVNEGLIEWPPSPWRLLRGLLSTGYTAMNWGGDLAQPTNCTPPDEARSLFFKLATVLPQYHLPPAVGAHSRHYMPMGVVDKNREKTTLVFDTWARIGEGELAINWDVELTEQERSILAQLAERLGYLGRSESWVIARLAGDDELVKEWNCVPESDRAGSRPGWEQVALLAPVSPEGAGGYAAWREQAVAEALAALPLPDGKKKPGQALLKQRAKAEAPYPADLIACLQADTNWLRSHGWSQPPGSRRVFYWRKNDSLEVGAPRILRRTVSAPPVEAMLLSLSTASGNDHALPTTTRTLPQAELLHKALVGIAHRQGGHSKVLSGCDEQRRPLAGSHEHAHILPLDLDADGHLEHILIWAPMGLDAQAQTAIRAARQTFTKGGVGALKLALESVGQLAIFGRVPAPYGPALRNILGRQGNGTHWTSVTPFVPPRFLKSRGKNSLEGQIASELASRGLPVPIEIHVMDPTDTLALRIRHFVRNRRLGPAAPVDCGFALRLQFAESVRGPLCLGYGSHFGLGLFTSAETK